VGYDGAGNGLAKFHLNDRDSYYGRDMAARFGRYQRSFCNMCHLKD
jgi:hypothetical protein